MPKSMPAKLQRCGFELSADSDRKNLNDIAGIRVIRSYIDDIFMTSKLLTSQSDIELVRTRDYIKIRSRTDTGARIRFITVPVFLSVSTEVLRVEVRICSIAMDLWAYLVDELAYMPVDGKTVNALEELKNCAEIIHDTALRMQRLYGMIRARNEFA